MSFLLLVEVAVEGLVVDFCHSHTATSCKLQDAVFFEFVEQCLGLVVVSGLFDYGKLLVDFKNARVVGADYCLKVALGDKFVGRHFVEGNLLVDKVCVGVDKCLQHIDALFNLHHDFLRHVGVAVGGDGEFMYARNRRRRHRQTFNVHAAAREDNRDLVEQTDAVFGENGECV